MAFIKYTGLAHIRELAVEDFKKFGVAVKKGYSFARHEVTEVADDVADALTKELGDEFDKVQADTKAAITPPATPATIDKSGSTA